jgi:hypothetical protein
VSTQEQIRRRPNKGGGSGGGSNDFDGLGLEMAVIPGVDEVLNKLNNDLQNLGGLINRTQERIDQKQNRRPSRSCEC